MAQLQVTDKPTVLRDRDTYHFQPYDSKNLIKVKQSGSS